MKNRIVTFAVLLVMVTMGTWAQNLPGGIWTSPQSATTEGRYRSNADNFIRPDQYTGVKFDKWFGLAAFMSEDEANYIYTPVATAGFATKVNDLYIGAFYNGNFWSGAPANNYTEQQFSGTAPSGGVTGKIYNVYNNLNAATGPVNNFAVLIGVADMGFRLTYRTNHQLFTNNDIVEQIGTGATAQFQLYRDYQVEGGYIAPQIAWAMAKNLTGNGIRPYATLDLVFERDYKKVRTAGADANGNTGANILRSANHFDPVLSLGMGGYTFYNQDGFQGSFDVDYVLTLNIYDNEYSYAEGTQYKTATFYGTYIPGSGHVEKSYVSNLLTPSLSGSWSKDKLALRFKLNLPLMLVNQQGRIMSLNSANKLVYNGNSDTTTTFNFWPDLRLALQYKLVPDRLTLNAGARIQATILTLETVDHEYYNNGVKDKTQTSTIHQNSFTGTRYDRPTGGSSSFVSRFSLGATFNFTENAWVEAATGINGRWGNNAVKVFESGDEGGLFNFGSIMVGLKF